MEEKKLTATIEWHLVKREGNPQRRGGYIVTTEKGTVMHLRLGDRYNQEKGQFETVWKTQKGVNVLAWAELPDPCEACPIEVIKARKEYEAAKRHYEKALEKFSAVSKEWN